MLQKEIHSDYLQLILIFPDKNSPIAVPVIIGYIFLNFLNILSI